MERFLIYTDLFTDSSGSLLIYLIMKKLKLDSKLPKLFNTDFNLNNRLKNILLVIILLIIIVFDILLCIELIDSNKYKNNGNYEFIKSYKLEGCQEAKIYKKNNYKVYLECVDVYYEKNNEQFGMEEILNENLLNKDLIERLTDEKESIFDGGTEIYRSKEYDTTFIFCNTIDGNQNIYIGDYSMKYQENYCK